MRAASFGREKARKGRGGLASSSQVGRCIVKQKVSEVIVCSSRSRAGREAKARSRHGAQDAGLLLVMTKSHVGLKKVDRGLEASSHLCLPS